MSSDWTAGFAHPWISWDGIEGVGHEAGVVLVDGKRVPATGTACDVAGRAQDHEPDHDHCCTTFGDTPALRKAGLAGTKDGPVGISFGFHLENGLVATAMADDHDSYVVLGVAWRSVGPEIDLRVDPVTGETYAAVCGKPCCRDDEGRPRSTFHVGGRLNFESYDELVAILDRVSRIEVREETSKLPARPRPKKKRRAADDYGCITLEEWQRRNGMVSA